MMTKNNTGLFIIFTDVMNDSPALLCKDEEGNLYLCETSLSDAKHIKSRKKLTFEEAQIFVANASVKARRCITEQGEVWKKKRGGFSFLRASLTT